MAIVRRAERDFMFECKGIFVCEPYRATWCFLQNMEVPRESFLSGKLAQCQISVQICCDSRSRRNNENESKRMNAVSA